MFDGYITLIIHPYLPQNTHRVPTRFLHIILSLKSCENYSLFMNSRTNYLFNVIKNIKSDVVLYLYIIIMFLQYLLHWTFIYMKTGKFNLILLIKKNNNRKQTKKLLKNTFGLPKFMSILNFIELYIC